MSATINISIITNNWGVIGWLGDSPAYVFRNRNLVSLLEEHNNKYENFISNLNGKKVDSLSKDDTLTRVLPYYTIKENQVEESNIENLLQFKNFFLKINDKFVTGSDGIIDNMEGVLKKDKVNELSDYLSDDLSAYEITKKGVKGTDNISCLVLNITNKENQDE